MKISDIRRCWTLVSCIVENLVSIKFRGGVTSYELCVKFSKTRLAGVVEDQYGVDHDGDAWVVYKSK